MTLPPCSTLAQEPLTPLAVEISSLPFTAVEEKSGWLSEQ